MYIIKSNSSPPVANSMTRITDSREGLPLRRGYWTFINTSRSPITCYIEIWPHIKEGRETGRTDGRDGGREDERMERMEGWKDGSLNKDGSTGGRKDEESWCETSRVESKQT